MGIDIMKSLGLLYRHSMEIIAILLLLVVATIANQEFEAAQIVKESEEPLTIEPGNQYLVSEIMERQADGICMFSFVRSSGSLYEYPYYDNEPLTALVRDIRFFQVAESETTIFTAVALRPLAVEITLYNSEGEICGKAISQASPPFQQETANTFFGIDSDSVVIIEAKVPLNEEVEKISISYIEDRTKRHPLFFLFYHISIKTQNLSEPHIP